MSSTTWKPLRDIRPINPSDHFVAKPCWHCAGHGDHGFRKGCHICRNVGLLFRRSDTFDTTELLRNLPAKKP